MGIIGAITSVLLKLALKGAVIMLLWNALMPQIFGLTVLNYWQSMGLIILTSELFESLTISKED